MPVVLPDNSSASVSPAQNGGVAWSVTNTNTTGSAALRGNAVGVGSGVVGTSQNAAAVYGYATGYCGVLGESGGNDGVIGLGHAAGVNGVYGASDTGAGVKGRGLGGGPGGTFSSATGDGLQGVANSGAKAGIYARNDAGQCAGYFAGYVTASAYYTGSDARLKHSIGDGGHGLSAVLALAPKSFVLKADKTDKRHLGLVADDVQKAIPEAVHAVGEDGMLAIDYPALTSVLIKAIHELQERLAKLEATA